jgi:hypothetical protein
MLVASICTAPIAGANPVLREANIEAAFTTPTSCDVRAAFTISGGSAAAPAEHRLYTGEGATVERLEGPAMDAPAAGSTRRLHVLHVALSGSGSDSYTLRYRVSQPGTHAYRCPVWLPTIPADGRSRGVRVRVVLPASASSGGGGFPALEWGPDGGGFATLGHVPALLHIPFASGDEGATAGSRDISRTMDTVALVALAAGMLAFVWRRKRG